MAKKPKKKKEDKAVTQIKNDFGTASDLFKTYLPQAPLAHYADPYAVDDANLLNEREAFASPLMSAYSPDELKAAKANLDDQVRSYGISQAQADAELDRLSKLTKHNPAFAGNIDDDTMAIINRMQAEAAPGYQRSQRSPERQAIIDRLGAESNTAGQNSADIQDIIDRFKGGLDGYTAAENNAFREAGLRSINDTAANSRYNAQRDVARNRVRGAAANAVYAGIDRDKMRATRDFEQDLFIKNADEKQNRLKTYADFARTNDDTNYARKNAAFGDYRNYLTDTENQEYDRGQKNFGDFRDFLTAAHDTAYNRGQTAVQSWQDALRQSQGHAFDVGQFNLGQDDKTQARDVGGLMGIMGLLGDRRSQERQDKILGK